MTGVINHPHGPRVYVAGRRLHHGSVGLALAIVAAAAHRPRLAAIGLVLLAHDAADFPFRDCDNHARGRRTNANDPEKERE
jgi:hypothetical protein